MYQVEEPREKQNGEELEKVMIAVKELKIMSKCQGRLRKARGKRFYEKIIWRMGASIDFRSEDWRVWWSSTSILFGTATDSRS